MTLFCKTHKWIFGVGVGFLTPNVDDIWWYLSFLFFPNGDRIPKMTENKYSLMRSFGRS